MNYQDEDGDRLTVEGRTATPGEVYISTTNPNGVYVPVHKLLRMISKAIRDDRKTKV